MLFHNDIWDFVYYVDTNNLDNQEKRFFDGTTEKVVRYQERKSLEMIICLVSNGTWKVVDENFYQSKLETRYIKFGTKINIDVGSRWELYTLTKIGYKLFVITKDGNSWNYNHMESDDSGGVTIKQLKMHIGVDNIEIMYE